MQCPSRPAPRTRHLATGSERSAALLESGADPYPAAMVLARWRAWPRRYWVQGALAPVFVVGGLVLEVTTGSPIAYLLPMSGLQLGIFAVMGLHEQRSRRRAGPLLGSSRWGAGPPEERWH
jgi:hypothetical protein